MDHIARFNKRKQILEMAHDRHGLQLAADPSLVEAFLQSPTDLRSVEIGTAAFDRWWDFNVEVSEQEVKELLKSLENKYDAKKLDNLLLACRDSVLLAIVGPFGLGELVATMDSEKGGANVTTIHNAKQKIYAEAKDEYRRKNYTEGKNSNGESFEGSSKRSVGSHFTRSKLDESGHLTDAYTGKRVRGDTTSPDHIISCSVAHKNGMFMCPDQKKADFGTDQENLACTDRSINMSMRDHDKVEWHHKTQKERCEHNGAHFDIDPKRLQAQYRKGKAAAYSHRPGAAVQAKYFATNLARTGTREGAKVGVQQALGLLLSEFFKATFDEIVDVYRNGFSSGFACEGFLSVLKERLSRIGKTLVMRWQDACEAFTSGFLSGFISNLVTTVINAFFTTSKRIVRIIREGFFSLLKAIKMLCDPPDGMSPSEGAHEASKIIASGLVVTVGIVVEHKLSELMSTVPYSDLIVPALVGGVTGIATTFVVYLIDKLDLFSVNAREKHGTIMDKLEADFDETVAKLDSMLAELDAQSLLLPSLS